jgi:tRNA (guanine37-N1)-methyltransferase
MIHCYCFSKEVDQHKDVLDRVEKILGKVDAQIHKVRNVAPKKDMFCISFRLPSAVAFTLKRKTS